jgi:hypothetical protein
MRNVEALAIALTVFALHAVAQEHPARMLPGTSLAIPADLAPPAGEPIKCGFPILSYYVGRESGVQSLSLLSREERQTSLVSGGFRVHFDTTGSDAPALLDSTGAKIAGTARAFVDSVFSMLAHVVAYEIGTLRYLAPISDAGLGGGNEYDIYIMDLGSMYGETSPDFYTEEGGCSSSSITIDNDFGFVRPIKNRGLGGLRVTLAHEFHHAIQIGSYGFWAQDAYFHEITSTWMEDVVYPDVNDYYNYLTASWGQFRNPEKPFTSSDSYIPYSRAIWGHFVAKKYGADVMRETWDAIRTVRPHVAIDQALRAHGTDFGEAFSDWALWNYFTGPRAKPVTYYTDGAEYPQMVQSAVDFPGSARDVAGSLRSYASSYLLVERGTDTMTVILSNTDMAGINAATNPLLAYTLKLRSTRPDESYKGTPIGVYAKLDVADIAKWTTWFAVRDSASPGIDPSSFSSQRPFPSPFRPGRHACVYIPLDGADQQRGSLYIFSASYDLVRGVADCASVVHLGKQMFTWDGRMNNGSVAPTGVYLYVIDIPGGRITGKIPLVRE